MIFEWIRLNTAVEFASIVRSLRTSETLIHYHVESKDHLGKNCEKDDIRYEAPS